MSEKIWRVYTHTTPDGLKYVGVTSQDLKRRWNPSAYRDKSLYLYIEKFGWENIQHEVIYTCYDKKEALEIEDMMIQFWRDEGVCINKQRSGSIAVSDMKGYMKAYNKAYYEENAEEMKAYSKVYYKEHADEIKAQKKAYRDEHREERKAYNKAYFSKPENKVYSRVKAYNQRHPDNVTITPAQAKWEYTTYSFVPSFIKHDDIPNAFPIIPSEWEWCKR